MSTFEKQRSAILGLPRRLKQAIVVACDIVLSAVATWFAFSLRLEIRHVPSGEQWYAYLLAAVFFIPIFIRSGLYGAVFRYTGRAVVRATVVATLVYGAVLLTALLYFQFLGVPRSLGVIQPVFFFLLVILSRTIAAAILQDRRRERRDRYKVLIYGAGATGVEAIRALDANPEARVVAVIDDASGMVGRRIHGHPVIGYDMIGPMIERHGVSDILIADPGLTTLERRAVIDRLMDYRVRVRTGRSLSNLDTVPAGVGDELAPLDLIDRDPVTTQVDPGLARGKIVLVTGAGGSIGSELCRQLLNYAPAQMILIDHNEFGLYMVQKELAERARSTGTDLVVCLASVRDRSRMRSIFDSYQPGLVFHAAAYKHVPLVEDNVVEAVTNNIDGTLNVARAAMDCGAERFTLISTDKAVRPTNFMGASKRMSELVVQALAAIDGQKTIFSMVRFGNVLDSSGSVVPLFRSQIAAGGPVTVTDFGVTRYLMTIPEAVGLVLNATAMSRGGEVFVLDMGKPVRILDLAEKMIRLSGLSVRHPETNPNGDIEIVEIGLRPGEKLHEELLIGDNPSVTANPHIYQAREQFQTFEQLKPTLDALREAVEAGRIDAVRELLAPVMLGGEA